MADDHASPVTPPRVKPQVHLTIPPRQPLRPIPSPPLRSPPAHLPHRSPTRVARQRDSTVRMPSPLKRTYSAHDLAAQNEQDEVDEEVPQAEDDGPLLMAPLPRFTFGPKNQQSRLGSRVVNLNESEGEDDYFRVSQISHHDHVEEWWNERKGWLAVEGTSGLMKGLMRIVSDSPGASFHAAQLGGWSLAMALAFHQAVEMCLTTSWFCLAVILNVGLVVELVVSVVRVIMGRASWSSGHTMDSMTVLLGVSLLWPVYKWPCGENGLLIEELLISAILFVRNLQQVLEHRANTLSWGDQQKHKAREA